jgi:hypothetical protein
MRNFKAVQLSDHAPKYAAYQQVCIAGPIWPFHPGEHVTVLVPTTGRKPRYLVQSVDRPRVMSWVFEDDLKE